MEAHIEPVPPGRDGGWVDISTWTDEALFRAYQRNGDRRIRNRLVERHAGCALWCARRFEGRGERLDDLRQEALVALVRAVDRFDPNYGVEFLSFAVPTILGALQRHFRDRVGMLRPSRRVHDLRPVVSDTTALLTQELARAPTHEEIAARAGLTADDVREVHAAQTIRTLTSLDALRGGTEPRLHPRAASQDALTTEIEDRIVLDHLLGLLPTRERQITRLYYQHGWNQLAIGRQFGLSQMHISRLLQRSVEHLRLLAAEDPRCSQPHGPHGSTCFLCRNMTWPPPTGC